MNVLNTLLAIALAGIIMVIIVGMGFGIAELVVEMKEARDIRKNGVRRLEHTEEELDCAMETIDSLHTSIEVLLNSKASIQKDLDFMTKWRQADMETVIRMDGEMVVLRNTITRQNECIAVQRQIIALHAINTPADGNFATFFDGTHVLSGNGECGPNCGLGCDEEPEASFWDGE